MDTSPVKYIERIIEKLVKKKALLLDILELTRTQTDSITEDGMDKLGSLIAAKQEKIDEIDKLDEEFSIYYERLKSSMGISQLNEIDISKLGGEAHEKAVNLKELTAEILDIIQNISEIEKVNNRNSKILLDKFSNEIRKINQGKRANNAYRKEVFGTPSYFLDKKK